MGSNLTCPDDAELLAGAPGEQLSPELDEHPLTFWTAAMCLPFRTLSHD
jgi:hypothetical protein